MNDHTVNPPGTLSANIEIDDERDQVTIFGIRYNGSLFRGLGFSMRPEIDHFRILSRADGVVTIETVYQEGSQQ